MSDDELLVFRYTGKGLVPGVVANRPVEHVGAIQFLGNEIVAAYPVVKSWKVPSPRTVDVEALVTRRGDYSSLRHVRYETAYPVIEGYKDAPALGFHATFADRLFGPTKTSRRGWSLGAGYDRTLRLDEPAKWMLSSSVTQWGDLETLPDAQGVAAGTDRLLEGDVAGWRSSAAPCARTSATATSLALSTTPARSSTSSWCCSPT